MHWPRQLLGTVMILSAGVTPIQSTGSTEVILRRWVHQEPKHRGQQVPWWYTCSCNRHAISGARGGAERLGRGPLEVGVPNLYKLYRILHARQPEPHGLPWIQVLTMSQEQGLLRGPLGTAG